MKTKRNIPFLLMMLFTLYLARCAESPTSPNEEEVQLTAADFATPREALVYFQNSFGLKLLSLINSESTIPENLFISPLSISMALGMTMNGAAGETWDAMQQTLGFNGLTEDVINQTCLELMDHLTGLDPGVVFQIANSIWYHETFPIAPGFVDVNRTFFDAEVNGLDFGNPEAVQIINDWVNEKTNGKISEILKAIPPETVMFLINALYFKGDWTNPFNPAETRNETFHLPDGSIKQVPTMFRGALDMYIPYYHDLENDIEAISLAYGDSLFSMTILIPGRDWHIDEFIDQLNKAVWDTCISNLQPTYFEELHLPKFKIDYEIKLNSVLKSMGMGIAFDGSADFSRMTADSSRGLFIDEVKHKTFVEVNEKGTEAAAVTVVSANWSAPPVIRVNRPFVFTISDHQTGTIMFIGKVMDPTLEN